MTQVKGPIDVHSHLVPKELLTELGASISGEGDFTIKVAGKTIGPVTRGFFDVEARMKENERLGVGTQVVSMTHHLFMYNEKVETATKVAKRYNELMSRVCAEHADFVCNATVPLQDGKKAAEELEHAYELGLRGVEIGTNVGGRNLDDQSLFDFYAKAQELNLPIFVHPGDIMAQERLKKYYMEIVVGTLAETMVAVSSVLFGGVLRQFPRLKLVFCHGGGAIPYQLGRLRRATEVRQELKGVDVGDVKRLYFDTVLFEASSLKFLIEAVGAERVVLGTDYPFNMGDWEAVKLVNSLNVSENVKRRILFDNASEIYNVK